MRTLPLLLACLLAGCGSACPEGVPLTDADLPCGCAGQTVDALPGCGELVCTEDGADVVLDDTAGDADTGDAGAGCG